MFKFEDWAILSTRRYCPNFQEVENEYPPYDYEYFCDHSDNPTTKKYKDTKMVLRVGECREDLCPRKQSRDKLLKLAEKVYNMGESGQIVAWVDSKEETLVFKELKKAIDETKEVGG